MKSYRNKFKEYLNDLARKTPAPGGGSAVCLELCMGLALMEKALVYSLNNDKRLKKPLALFKKLRLKTLPYVDLDGKLFDQIMRAKGLPKRKLIRKSEALIVDAGKTSLKAFAIAKRLDSGIKKSIISDFNIGLKMVRVSLEGCIFNLLANKIMFNRENKYLSIFKNSLKKWDKS